MFARAALAIAAAAAAGLLAAAPARRPGPEIVRGDPHRFLVRLEAVVANAGTAPLRGVVCHALLPLELPRQHVRWLRLSPHGWSVRADGHGQTVATSAPRDLPPGGAETWSWIASADLRAEDHAPRLDRTAAIPPEARRYLADHERFGLGAPEIRAAAVAARAAAACDSPLALSESAAGFVKRRMRFDLDGRWDAAPVALARGSGSCSEMVFALAAICRRLGVPARWTGGTLLRSGPPGRTCDETFHRVAEIWIPGHGWRPVEAEPERGSRVPGPALPHTFLLLARGDASGDGADEPPLADGYHARFRWTAVAADAGGARPRPRVWVRAWWLSGADDALALGGRPGDVSVDLDAAAHPSFVRGELMVCDALGFGAPLDAFAAPLADAPAPARRARDDVADTLLAAGHPEGLRLAASAWRGDEGALRAVARCCEGSLADEFLGAARGNAAEFETWWGSRASAIEPRGRGRFGLAGER